MANSDEAKVCIITGANSGIGKESAKMMFEKGFHVIMACRSEEGCEKARQEIFTRVQDKPQDKLKCMTLELDNLASVRQFASNFQSTNLPLHVLINNAAVSMTPFQKTKDGFEMQFGVNHMGHFLLTNLLLDKLKQSSSSRIVVVASDSHKGAKTLDLENINHQQGYGRMVSYSQSKLCNVLFTYELSRRLQKQGVTNVTVNAVHPGVVNTNIGRYLPSALQWIGGPIAKLFFKTVEEGAQGPVYLATSPQVEGVTGKYFVGCKEEPSSPLSYNQSLAAEVWDRSQRWLEILGHV